VSDESLYVGTTSAVSRSADHREQKYCDVGTDLNRFGVTGSPHTCGSVVRRADESGLVVSKFHVPNGASVGNKTADEGAI